MTATIHDIGEAKPHATGEARCTSCRHEWVAVAPVGVDWLECPACSLMKGRYVHPIVRGGVIFECYCGTDVFHIAPAGPYCTGCGKFAVGWDVPPVRPAS